MIEQNKLKQKEKEKETLSTSTRSRKSSRIVPKSPKHIFSLPADHLSREITLLDINQTLKNVNLVKQNNHSSQIQISQGMLTQQSQDQTTPKIIIHSIVQQKDELQADINQKINQMFKTINSLQIKVDQLVKQKEYFKSNYNQTIIKTQPLKFKQNDQIITIKYCQQTQTQISSPKNNSILKSFHSILKYIIKEYTKRTSLQKAFILGSLLYISKKIFKFIMFVSKRKLSK